MRLLRIRALAVVALAVGSILPSAPPSLAAAPAPKPLAERCTPSLDGRRAVVLDCRPGFATPHDRIVVVPRGGVDPAIDPAKQLDQNDAVWLFEPGATTRVALLIDFHRNSSGRPVADLFDDGDGNGSVEYVLADGVPKALEHEGRPTVTVTSLDKGWLVGGRPSFNLDISVDGSVRASFGSAAFLADLAYDGVPDFAIHVRDLDQDGRPDLDWRQFQPPLPADPRVSGYIRTEIVANPAGDEVPLSGSLFWPYLAEVPSQFHADHFVKDYGRSPAPIEVDWTTARVVQVSEFVASRGNAGNYFIYSINRIPEGATTAADFESPFAFYDLAGAGDGWPDLSIRFKATLPDEGDGPRRNADPINVIQYSWGRLHDHNWTYALSLAGHQTVDQTIPFPGFAVRAVPPASLPGWVANQAWDAATFVEVTPPYATTEGVTDYTVEQGNNVLTERYLPGLDPTPPVGVFSQAGPGIRGEYAFNLDGRTARLYLSPIDLRLHLVGAEGGVWNMGGGRELQYESVLGQGIDHWSLAQGGATVADLYVMAGQAIFASADGVSVGQVRKLARPTPISPPTDHGGWVRLGALLDGAKPPFAPDDLQAMFHRIATSIQALPGAAVSSVRRMDQGFRFHLILAKPAPKVAWTAGHVPGSYLATYRPDGGFAVAALTPATMAVGPVSTVGGEARATDTVELTADVANRGHADAGAVRITFLAGRAGATLAPVGAAVINVPGDGIASARATWIPPDGGTWLVQARVDGSAAVGPLATIAVGAGPDRRPTAVIGSQEIPAGPLVMAGALLVIGALLATASVSRLLRR